MKNRISRICILNLFTMVTGLFFFQPAYSQDSIHTIYNELISCKVIEVSPRRIRYEKINDPADKSYTINRSIVDSIVYNNGKVELMEAKEKKDQRINIPQLNTMNFDFFGFAYFTLSQRYERRLKNGKVGFAIPLYIQYNGGEIAGTGPFKLTRQSYGNLNNYDKYSAKKGYAISSGLNIKCYLFKRRVVRVFAGPEICAGYSTLKGGASYVADGNFYTSQKRINMGTFSALGKTGLSINPLDRLNITIDGGAGIGDVFGHSNPVGLTGLWQVGLGIGTNF